MDYVERFDRQLSAWIDMATAQEERARELGRFDVADLFRRLREELTDRIPDDERDP